MKANVYVYDFVAIATKIAKGEESVGISAEILEKPLIGYAMNYTRC